MDSVRCWKVAKKVRIAFDNITEYLSVDSAAGMIANGRRKISWWRFVCYTGIWARAAELRSLSVSSLPWQCSSARTGSRHRWKEKIFTAVFWKNFFEP